MAAIFNTLCLHLRSAGSCLAGIAGSYGIKSISSTELVILYGLVFRSLLTDSRDLHLDVEVLHTGRNWTNLGVHKMR